MAVMYKLRQEKNPKSKFTGQWYARAIAIETVDTATIANIMQQNCTVKKADILAVIAELIDVLKDQLQNSKSVRLDGLGTFRIGIKTKPALTAEDFNVTKNVVGTHVLFRPQAKVNKDKTRNKALLDGCRVQELPLNMIEKKKKKDNTPVPTPGH